MSRVAYIRAWPRDPETGAAGLVAMAAGGSHLPYYLDGIHYRAGGVREPRFAAALGFDEKGWTGAALPTVSTIEFAPSVPALLREYAALYWKGAPIEVDAGEEYSGLSRTLTGTIADATVRDDRLQITVADFGVKLAKPAIQSWFAGTGGIEGDAVCEGRVKRRSYGYCANIEGRVLLAAYNIYEFGDPARPSQAIPVVRHMGRQGFRAVLAWQGSIAATLNALIATPPPEGGGIVAPSINCVKWWTQPQGGPLTADVQGDNVGGYVDTGAQIASRLLAAAGGPAIANLADATALRPAVVGLHIGDDSETTSGALDRLLLPISLMWRFSATGQIDIRPWSWDGSAEFLQGRFIAREKSLAPMKARRLGYNRNHRQMNDGEIAADILAAGVSFPDGSTLVDLKDKLDTIAPGATVGGTIGIDIRIPEIPGIPAPPGLIRNDLLKLREDGHLVYQPYGDPAVVEELGRVTPAGIGAADDAARRQLETAVDRLGGALTQALSEASRTRQTFRDAGVYVDPADGTVKIAAIEQTAERVNEAYIRLSAAESAITLRATQTYVDSAIASAVLDPSQVPAFQGLDIRITEAEIRIDGAEAAIEQKASIITVDALGVRLGAAEINIDALSGQIALKVDSTEFDDLGVRVTSAEATLSAIGDTASLKQAVTAARQLPAAIGDAHENALRALLAGDLGQRTSFAAIADARNELTVKINDDLSAEARARQELIIRVGAAETSALIETQLRIDGDRAVSQQVTDLTASIDNQLAAYSQQITALVDGSSLIVAGLSQTVSAVRGLGEDASAAAESALMGLLNGDRSGRDQNAAIAAAREELTVKINEDTEAVGQRVFALLARIGVAEASIVAEELVRATANLAIVSQLDQLSATVGGVNARVAAEELARATQDEALAASVATLRADMQAADASITAQATTDRQARVTADSALASSIDQLRVEKNNGDAALLAQANLDRQARIDADGVIAASVDALRVEKNNDDATIKAQANLDRQARIDNDTALASSVDQLRVEKNAGDAALSAQANLDRQARIDGDGALAASVQTLTATINGQSGEIEDQRAVLVDLQGRVTAYVRIAAVTPGGQVYLELVADSHAPSQIVLGGNTKIDGNAVIAGSMTVDALVVNSAVVPAFVYTNETISGPGWGGGPWDGGGNGGVGGGSGGGGGGGGGQIP